LNTNQPAAVAVTRVNYTEDGGGRSTRKAGNCRPMASSVLHDDQYSLYGSVVFSHARH